MAMVLSIPERSPLLPIYLAFLEGSTPYSVERSLPSVFLSLRE